MSTVTVKLQRPDPSQPWGFRIHGGVDFNQPLVILRVTAGSLSAQQGLVPGDQIIKINGQDSLRLRHREAQELILSTGNEVVFEVVRGDMANLQRVLNNEAPITLNSLKQKSSSSTTTRISSSTTSNVLATMVQSTSAVSTAAVTGGQVPWAGPKYTEESIKETLTSQAQVLETGAIGVNFIKKDRDELDLKKSEVLKMLNEIESERKDRARSPSVPPPSNQSTFGIYMNRHYESTLLATQPQAPWAGTQQLSPSIPQQEPVQREPEQNPPATAVEAS